MYWFRPPVADSIDDWTALNQRALWWGRRPELGWTRRNPVGFFDPVSAVAAPRVRVGAAALRYRPHRGVHLSLSRMPHAEDPTTIAAMAEYDRRTVPAVLDVPGVAGASIYRLSSAATGMGATTAPSAEGTLMVRLLHLDADPVACMARVMEEVPEWVPGSLGAAGVEEILFSSPLRSITPGEWDWFDPT
jgi:hypothetical protein